jgi:hypothetical protein
MKKDSGLADTRKAVTIIAESLWPPTGAIVMTSPFDVPRNHRLLATIAALEALYGATGLVGVTAKIRDAEVNRHLISFGKAPVSADVVRKAMRILRERGAACK